MTGKDDRTWQPPAGGRGYYRTASLVSIWATAPFLHNNSLGIFNGDPSVTGRIAAYNDAVHKLLWPKDRDGVKTIKRTTARSYLNIRARRLGERRSREDQGVSTQAAGFAGLQVHPAVRRSAENDALKNISGIGELDRLSAQDRHTRRYAHQSRWPTSIFRTQTNDSRRCWLTWSTRRRPTSRRR